MATAYCMKCKKKVEIKNPKQVTLKNSRPAVEGICVTSGEVGQWLINFFKRFDSEIQFLYKEEPFWKSCYKCVDSHCCKKPTLPIMAAEWDLIRDFVQEQFLPKNKERLLQKIESPSLECIYLVGNHCSVYPVRPWICRLFPYTISFYSSPITTQVGGIALPSCPTFVQIFGLKVDELFFQYPKVLTRHRGNNLVQCKLKKHRPLWLIDGTEYWREYEREMPKNENGVLDGMNMHEWVGIAKLGRDQGVIEINNYLAYFGLSKQSNTSASK